MRVWIDTDVGSDVDDALKRIAPTDVATYMLTSGSTGEPKAVINTHEMVAANAKRSPPMNRQNK